MTAFTYLSSQRLYLAKQLLTCVATEVRDRHAVFLTSQQNADGGFPGREGPSDLYYTAFGLWGLDVLGALTPEVGAQASAFLQANLEGCKNLIDCFSLLHGSRLVLGAGSDAEDADADRRSQQSLADFLADGLETFRTRDGGYNRTPGQTGGSTYATFLTVLCYEELGRPVPEPERVLAFIESRSRADGGYVEIGPMKRSGVNPTAAAVAVLHLLNPETDEDARRIGERTVEYLRKVQSPEGGFRANARAPMADLLSTFTALWTLADLGALDQIDRREARWFVAAQEFPTGGFRAGLWDNRVDVEYTLYGLGSLALVSTG